MQGGTIMFVIEENSVTSYKFTIDNADCFSNAYYSLIMNESEDMRGI